MPHQSIYATPAELALSVHLDILSEQLTYCATMARKARDCMNQGNREEAVMNLSRFERELRGTLALHVAANVLDGMSR